MFLLFTAAFPLATSKSPQAQWQTLRDSADYRQFLKAYLDLHTLNYSDLGRMTGFGRSFPSDVINGRRSLTAKSYAAFAAALKLKPIEKKLFRLLVAKEEPQVLPEYKNQSIDVLIQDLRKKATPVPRRDVVKAKNSDLEVLLKNPDVLSVYAACGEPGKGASLEKIHQRTQLNSDRLSRAIKDLEKVNLVKWENGLYEPMDLHLFLGLHQ